MGFKFPTISLDLSVKCLSYKIVVVINSSRFNKRVYQHTITYFVTFYVIMPFLPDLNY